MSPVDFAVDRPISTLMLFLGICILGFISLQRIPVELLPDLGIPRLNIVTEYPQAGPEEIERLITRPLEEILSGVEGIKEIRSLSGSGLSRITLLYDWGKNMNKASTGVREKLDMVKAELPKDCGEPVIIRNNMAESPIISVAMWPPGPILSMELRRKIAPMLERIEGVAACKIEGYPQDEVIVEIDKEQLRANGLSLKMVGDIIKGANFGFPSGRIDKQHYAYLIRTAGELKDPKELGKIPISRGNKGEMVLLEDLAKISVLPKERKEKNRFRGMPAISLSIVRESGANGVEVGDRVKAQLKEIMPTLEKERGIKYAISYDGTIYIRKALNGVRDSAFLGGFLAFLILWLFLGKLRVAGIILLAIPISILATFNLLYFAGISLNMMSLGGLAIGVGMLVDNAIVVLESMAGEKKGIFKERARAGAGAIWGAVMASTLTTVVVFLPVAYMGGIAGRLFLDQALSISCALFASLLMSLMLVPMLYSKLGKEQDMDGENLLRPFGLDFFDLEKLSEKYQGFLGKILEKPGLFLLAGMIILSLPLLGIFFLPAEFMPVGDEGQIIVELEGPGDTPMAKTQDWVQGLEGVLAQIGEVESFSSIIGKATEGAGDYGIEENKAQIMISLKPSRKKSSQDIANIIREKAHIPVQLNFRMENQPWSGASDGTVRIDIKGPDLSELRSISGKLEKALSKISGLVDIRQLGAGIIRQISLVLDREKLAQGGMSVEDAAGELRAGIWGNSVGTLERKDENLEIFLRLEKSQLQDPKDLVDFPLINGKRSDDSGPGLSLGEAAKLNPSLISGEIFRIDGERTMPILADISGRFLGSVLGELRKFLRDYSLPDDYLLELRGEADEIDNALPQLAMALILAILLVAMILAAQLESLILPLIIMLSVPMALSGVVIALLITNTSISIISFFGTIMLAGIAVNNAILLIDRANNAFLEGQDPKQAALDGAKKRLRPIIMTTATTILGLLPMALPFSQGYQLRAPLAIAVIGGLGLSTLLTLFIVPAGFVFIKQRKR